ncbi:MAG: DUF3828 domain-containing protein [Candidatus Colwellbacteria bacterium]
MSENLKRAISIAVVVVVIAVIAFFVFKGADKQEVSIGDPVNIVLDFYEPWLSAVQATSTDPYASGLAQTPILSKELRTRLTNASGQPETELDPVLCQTTIPTGISARPIYEREGDAKVLVMSTEEGALEQAVVELIRHKGGWYINDIVCSPGEFDPPREFSFEREGHLLKGGIPSPYDSKHWHLVFEEDGQPGHVAPLFFGPESMCQDLDGNTSVCNPDQLMETSKASVRGEMTELGVEVKRLELME